jgi:hypothetical protein
VQLRRQLERSPEDATLSVEAETGDEHVPRPKLVVIDESLEFRDRMTSEARGIGVDVVGDAAARDALGVLTGASAVVVDLAGA